MAAAGLVLCEVGALAADGGLLDAVFEPPQPETTRAAPTIAVATKPASVCRMRVVMASHVPVAVAGTAGVVGVTIAATPLRNAAVHHVMGAVVNDAMAVRAGERAAGQ